MSQPIRGRAAILFFRPARKTQTLWRTLRSCFLFSFVEFRLDAAEKLKMSQPVCQVSLNTVQRIQRRSRKCLCQSKAGAAILFFRSTRKNTKLAEDVEILLPVKFRWIPIRGFREVVNVKNQQRSDDSRIRPLSRYRVIALSTCAQRDNATTR